VKLPVEFLSPSLLWLLTLVAPLILLYILKVQRKRLKVASTWLWQQARRDLMARSPFKKLVVQIPLILQLLALITLALAAARPATRGKALGGDHVAIIIDTSASMAARDPSGKTRIELAKDAALELIASLPPGSDAMILDAGRDTRIALPPDRDVRRMRTAVDKLSAREVEGDLSAAVTLAVGRLEQMGGDKHIVVLSDGNLAKPAPLTSRAIPLELIRVGEPVDNSGIVRVDVRSGTDPMLKREQVQAFLLIANYGKRSIERYVTMRQRNASDVLASRKVVVEPGSKLPVVLTFNPAEGDYGSGLVFDMSPHDALPVDDVAYGRVPAGRKLPVYLASAGNESPWLLRALVSDPNAEVRAGTLDELLSETEVAHDALVVIDGACPPEAPGGDLLIVNPPVGDCFGTEVGRLVDAPVLTSWQHGDPRMRFLTLESVLVSKARVLVPQSNRQALIRTDQGVIASDVSTSSRAATLLGFHVGDTNWPLKRSFVLFVRNLMEQARGHRSSGFTGPAIAGDPLRVSLPAAVQEANIEPPSGDGFTVPVRSGLAVVPEVQRTGLYRVAWDQPHPGQLWLPVNLTSADESDLTRVPVDIVGAKVAIASADQAVETHRDWSWVLALAALGLLLLDVWYLSRSQRHAKTTRLRHRPVLLIASLLSALPAVYVALVWTRIIPEAYLRFERPWLGLLALPAMVYVAVRLSSQHRHVSRLRRTLGDLMVSTAVLAAAMAATGPELGRPLDRLTVITVVDRSRSIDLVPAAATRIQRELTFAETDMREHDLIGRVVFGANAATEDPPRGRSTLPTPQQVDIGRDGTDISAGLKHALAEVPADSAARLVLFSDGVATRGDVMSAAAAAVASDIPIDVIALEQREVPDVRVVAFRATPRASEGETLGMRVVISSPRTADVEIRVKRDGVLVQRLQAKVAAGEDVVQFPHPAGSSGLHRYDVEVTAADPTIDETAEDNSASAFVRVRGPARALVLDGDVDKTSFIGSALTRAGFRVDQGSTSSVPADIGGMAVYDLIVFGDIPAHHLSTHQVESLASYVRDLGGGLLLTGGDRSFGPGGYARTPLEDVSPVSFDLKQDQRRASLAEVIAIDISGSMGANVGGSTKLELANEAAVRSADLLGAGDQLGVLHVDTAPRWAVNVAPVKDLDAIKRAIRAVGPGGGGILVDVALTEAYAALAKVSVNLKHVLLFADGSDAENITPAVQASVSHAASHNGITTSCVSLGRGHHSAKLEDLSARGSGRFYIVEDATRLPAVFAQETVLASRASVIDKDFTPQLASSHSILRNVELSAAPMLHGYVVTIVKPRSTTILTGPESDPILATWTAGVGQTAAFTSDLMDRWGGEWTQWEGAARLVAQTARHITRREDDKRVRLEADASSGQLHLRATVVDDDGRMQSFRRLRVTVTGPDGFKRDIPLDSAGAGTYASTIPLSRPGAYIAVARDEASGHPVATTGAALSAGEELRPTGTDNALLTRVVDLTGGKRRDTLAGVFLDRASLRFAYRDITMVLLMVAAFTLLLAVAARRLAFSDDLAQKLAARFLTPLRRKPHAEAAPGSDTSKATLDQLLAKRERSGETEHSVASPSAAHPSRSTAQTGAPRPSRSAGTTAPRAVTPRATPQAPPHRTAARKPSATSEPTAEQRDDAGRPLTAAEILLQRRKRKRNK